MSDYPRNWLMSCGACGTALLMVNCKPTLDGGGCDACRDDVHRNPLDPDGEPWSMLVQHEAGWCACGDEDQVDWMMQRYLRMLADDRRPEAYEEDVPTLMAYIADSLGWTEHGGSVGGAWLTDDGREALSNLEARLLSSPSPRGVLPEETPTP
jgi:hypothetical protein